MAQIYRVGKIDAAVDQLDWAIRLLIDHKAYVPAITLAGAAEEIIGEAVASESAFRKLKESLSADTEFRAHPLARVPKQGKKLAKALERNEG